MLNVEYLATHKVQMHAGAIDKLLYGFASVLVIIHLLKLMDYLPEQTHELYSNLHLYNDMLCGVQ